MGLFKKRLIKPEAKIENLNITPFNQEPPITGGNTYETQKILEAQDLINKNTIPKMNFGKYNSKIEESSYNFWWLLQFHANYFTSLMRVKTSDAKMNEMIYNCFRVHFMFGGCGIYKKGDLILCLYENKVVTNEIGEIEKIEFKYIHDLLACRNLDEYKAVTKTITFSADELEKNYARLRPTSIGFGAIVTWMPFIKQQVSLLKKIYMYSFIFHRKISYKAADISTSTTELDAFFNEDVPFYIELDADMGTGNKFTSESINGGTNGGVVELKAYYDFFLETYYHLLGRRYNVDDKKERNISTEVTASQSNFDILHNEDRVVKEDFLDAITRIFGIDWEDLDEKEKEDAINDAERINDRHDMSGNSRNSD